MITLIYDLVIGVDTNNYTLMLDRHKKNKNGKPMYEKIGYYGTLEAAVCGAREYCVRKQFESDMLTLADAIEVIKRTTKDFSDLLKKVSENNG